MLMDRPACRDGLGQLVEMTKASYSVYFVWFVYFVWYICLIGWICLICFICFICFMCFFLCLFACLLAVCLFACLFLCSFVPLFLCSFVSLFLCLLILLNLLNLFDLLNFLDLFDLLDLLNLFFVWFVWLLNLFVCFTCVFTLFTVFSVFIVLLLLLCLRCLLCYCCYFDYRVCCVYYFITIFFALFVCMFVCLLAHNIRLMSSYYLPSLGSHISELWAQHPPGGKCPSRRAVASGGRCLNDRAVIYIIIDYSVADNGWNPRQVCMSSLSHISVMYFSFVSPERFGCFVAELFWRELRRFFTILITYLSLVVFSCPCLSWDTIANSRPCTCTLQCLLF